MPAPGQRLERTVPIEVSERSIRDALIIVERLDPPDDLRVAVFTIAAQHASQFTLVDSPVEVARNSGAFHNPR